ncbi:MAG: squalene/phytoene synthase family protein [Parvibaculales bacterium]
MDEELLRQELRGLDGDLYLCHLFAPAEKRGALLTLYHLYADIARIPASVSDPMVGAIRLQWWRDLFDAVANGDGRGTPIGEALLVNPLPKDKVLPLIDGREAALPEGTRNIDELQAEAQVVGPALMRLACDICGENAPDRLLENAGTGFELLRLVSTGADEVAARAHTLLVEATRAFNKLPRRQRKSLLPVFLPIGLARRQAARFPQQRSLLIYQLILLKMALTGRL